MTTTKFFEQSISPANGGFGQYQAQPINGDAWADDSGLVAEMAQAINDQGGELLELGVDELPDGVEDIRGRIHNEPARVFAVVHADRDATYIGIAAR